MKPALHKCNYEPDARGTLDGVRILDLSRLFAGNVLTLILGDFGAQVITVEPPKDDTLRKCSYYKYPQHYVFDQPTFFPFQVP